MLRKGIQQRGNDWVLPLWAKGRYFDTGQIIQVNGGFSLLDNGILLGGDT